ncbi:probable cytochrome P450 9f2 [Phlebotomus argentipes]|uniref:probable cytochrome P450 9f2 n=1 Tax=Phlebotomus argentipes TaxID=94469 RepID=UPI00289310BC|nr:probable cytochrome P450 9f2 [Phlebotomus argentipes]
MLVELLLLVAAALFTKFIIDKGYKNENYFKERGVKYSEPYYFVGNSGNIFTRQKSILKWLCDAYSSFPNERVCGTFEFRSPLLVIRDPELIKCLMIKEFDHFVNRRNIFVDENDPAICKSLFLLRGNDWRDMRATLSPAFTGSKMRLMFELISECSNQMVAFVNKETKEKGIQTYEMKDFCSRMSNDIIATCAFGIQVNSLKEQKNEFYLNGKNLTNLAQLSRIAKLVFMMSFPKICNALKVRAFPQRLISYFRSAILDAMQYREKNNVIRPDMIHLLMEAKKGRLTHQTSDKEIDSAGFATVEESQIGKQEGKKDLSDDDILAQCLIFFFAGFETVSTALSFLCYEMAVNPEIQERLFDEVLETNELLGQKAINYDTLQKMKYLDMVVSESLRKWTPLPFLDRVCTKEYVLDCGEGLKYSFKKGDVFVIFTGALHYDPQYFPDPEKFDPERFSDENKDKIIPGTYLPFGIGPRNCVGSRFALMEVKAFLFYLILNFKIEPNEKTQIPLKLTTNSAMASEKGIWVQLTPRSKE